MACRLRGRYCRQHNPKFDFYLYFHLYFYSYLRLKNLRLYLNQKLLVSVFRMLLSVRLGCEDTLPEPHRRLGQTKSRSSGTFSHKMGCEYRGQEVFLLPMVVLAMGAPLMAGLTMIFVPARDYSSSSLSTLMNAFCGISTFPTMRIRFFPSFCFSRSFFLRLISPP
jgi:hypothetical protein